MAAPRSSELTPTAIDRYVGLLRELRAAETRAEPRRSSALAIVRDPTWMPCAGLPAGGRVACRGGERPCRFVRCKWHLWMVDGRDRVGHSGAGRTTRSGFTEQPIGSTLLPRWLETPVPPSCALDIVEHVAATGEKLSNARLAELLGLRDGDTITATIRRARAKLATSSITGTGA
ncbi:MAG TPA: hypothetical protein VGF94_08450 [Kofleriaceae bacterium]